MGIVSDHEGQHRRPVPTRSSIGQLEFESSNNNQQRMSWDASSQLYSDTLTDFKRFFKVDNHEVVKDEILNEATGLPARYQEICSRRFVFRLLLVFEGG